MDTTDLLNSIRSRLDNWRRMVLSLHRDQTPTERIILYNCDLMIADIDEVLPKGSTAMRGGE
jgi:hypothetical protein